MKRPDGKLAASVSAPDTLNLESESHVIATKWAGADPKPAKVEEAKVEAQPPAAARQPPKEEQKKEEAPLVAAAP